MFRIFTVVVVGLVTANLGVAFYQEIGWGGVGIGAILAVVMAASIAALLFSPPAEKPSSERPERNS